MSNPVERIKRFIDARTGMRGLDPNIVHSINTNGEQENLTLPDLRALLADLERAEKDAERYRFLAAHCRSTSEHWGGRWSIVVEGPAPKTHDSEDEFDAAIDAALAQMAGGG